MSDRSQLQYGLFFVAFGFIFAICPTLWLTGDSTLTQIKLFKMVTNETSLSQASRAEIQRIENTASFFIFLGYVSFIFAVIMLIMIYKKIK